MTNSVTYENYKDLREKAGIHSDYAVAKATGIMDYKFSRWSRHGYIPKYLELRKIAQVLDCEVDDFYKNVKE